MRRDEAVAATALYGQSSRRTRSRSPFTKRVDSSVEKRRAISSASLMATLGGSRRPTGAPRSRPEKVPVDDRHPVEVPVLGELAIRSSISVWCALTPRTRPSAKVRTSSEAGGCRCQNASIAGPDRSPPGRRARRGAGARTPGPDAGAPRSTARAVARRGAAALRTLEIGVEREELERGQGGLLAAVADRAARPRLRLLPRVGRDQAERGRARRRRAPPPRCRARPRPPRTRSAASPRGSRSRRTRARPPRPARPAALAACGSSKAPGTQTTRTSPARMPCRGARRARPRRDARRCPRGSGTATIATRRPAAGRRGAGRGRDLSHRPRAGPRTGGPACLAWSGGRSGSRPTAAPRSAPARRRSGRSPRAPRSCSGYW